MLQYIRTITRDDHNAGEIRMCGHVIKTRLVMETSWIGRSVVGQTYWRSPSQAISPTARAQNTAWRRLGDVLVQASEDTPEITTVDGATPKNMHVRPASNADIDEAMDDSLKLVRGNSKFQCESKPVDRSWRGCSIQFGANSCSSCRLVAPSHN